MLASAKVKNSLTIRCEGEDIFKCRLDKSLARIINLLDQNVKDMAPKEDISSKYGFAITGKKDERSKMSNASILFPEIQKELEANKDLAGSLTGLFIIIVLVGGVRKEEWFLSFHGRVKSPMISQEKPEFTAGRKYKMPVCIIEIEDRDILKFLTGGLHGFRALREERIKIAGDILLAAQMEEVFIKTGGVEKVKDFFAKAKAAISKSKKTSSKL